MTDALAILALLIGAYCLVSAVRTLLRDARRRKPPVAATPDPLGPEPLRSVTLARHESWCPQCAARVAEHPNETLQRCPICGGALAHVSVVSAAPTPDEPTTLPDEPKGAA